MSIALFRFILKCDFKMLAYELLAQDCFPIWGQPLYLECCGVACSLNREKAVLVLIFPQPLQMYSTHFTTFSFQQHSHYYYNHILLCFKYSYWIIFLWKKNYNPNPPNGCGAYEIITKIN